MKFSHFCLCIVNEVYWLLCVILNLVHQLPFNEVLKPAVTNTAIYNCLNFPLIVVRIMQSKSCRYSDERDINCKESYGRVSSLLYRSVYKPR